MESYVVNFKNLNYIFSWKLKTGEKIKIFCASFYDNLSNTERIAFMAG